MLAGYAPTRRERLCVAVFVNDGLVITGTDNFGSLWDKAGIPYLSNHLGVVHLLCPLRPWRDLIELNCKPPLVITRGKFPCGCEAVEFLFSPPGSQSLYIALDQAGRLPGDPCRMAVDPFAGSRPSGPPPHRK